MFGLLASCLSQTPKNPHPYNTGENLHLVTGHVLYSKQVFFFNVDYDKFVFKPTLSYFLRPNKAPTEQKNTLYNCFQGPNRTLCDKWTDLNV